MSVGGFLVTASSNGFNQIIERNLDRLMDRTKSRPLVTGNMSVAEAISLSVIFGLSGTLILWFNFNVAAALLGILALFVYVTLYTPLKQISPWAVFVGAFPGAIPPMLGWVAATGLFSLEAGLLFAVQFMWQFPHFWAIAWKADSDYAKAGFRLLPSKGGKDKTSAFLMLVYSLFLLLVSLLPVFFNLTSTVALITFSVAGILMIYPAITLYRKRDEASATKLMFASFVYVPMVLIVWYLDKI
ncbi:MAG: protoheme IX farnesyltransferase [Verrucomicrobia bacterium]|nr:protoheme IX farnesyltransferase [Verrucomicrobiota bacterium]